MLFYNLIIMLSLLIGLGFKVNNSDKKIKFYIVVVFSALTLVSALRGNSVGMDTNQYIKAYENISYLNWNQLNEISYEIGFSVLCKFLSYISIKPQILIIISSMFIMMSVARFIYKNSSDVVMSVLLFITLNVFFNYMNIMRQAIAISIILCSYEYLKKNKYIKFSLATIIASLFHQSAIICLIFIFFEKLKYKYKYILILFFLIIITFIFFGKFYNVIVFLFVKYSSYMRGTYGRENYFGSLIEALVSLAIFSLGFICIKKDIFKEKNKSNILEYERRRINFLLWIMSAYIFFSVMTIKMNIFNRLVSYFLIFTIIWIPEAFKFIKNKKERNLYYYLVILLTLVYCNTILLFRPEWTGVIPYRLFFN